MLGSLRKFSGSVYAKILLGLVIIPFVFWGMGSSFFGGSKNVIVVINKEKYSIQEFSNFINTTANKKVESREIETFLSSFIGEKLLEKEIERYGIKLSDSSLSKLIKHQKDFKRENKFSRLEYEKFLLKNNITANTFESILTKQEKKKQLLDFIGGGIAPSNFLVNMSYNRINQKRNIELINLNDAFKKHLNFNDNEIKKYFEENKDKYIEIYKSIKILELTPNNLVSDNEFTDLFFKTIDEIDDLVISGGKMNDILLKYNLNQPKLYTINKNGKNINSENNNKISKDILEKIFVIDESEPLVLFENKNSFFIAELAETKNIEMNVNDTIIKKKIILELEKKTKRKLLVNIIDKINKKSFFKSDFDKFSKDESININKIKINNLFDDKKLNKEIVKQIYDYPEKRIIVVHDLNFSQLYLVHIEKIEDVIIKDNSDEYNKYSKISETKIASELYNVYDSYLKKEYEIDINYKALDVVKNYYN